MTAKITLAEALDQICDAGFDSEEDNFGSIDWRMYLLGDGSVFFSAWPAWAPLVRDSLFQFEMDKTGSISSEDFATAITEGVLKALKMHEALAASAAS